MSDRHESFIQKLFGGRISPGSGNQFNNQADVRHAVRSQYYTFAADGKSTLGKSIGVSLEMWDKLVEQSHSLNPLLPLRFYHDWRLTKATDLVVLEAKTFADILADANAYREGQQ
jgi:hypothetical protein